jgi:hypothetical protein
LASAISPYDVPTSPSDQELESTVRNSTVKSAQVIEIVSKINIFKYRYLTQSKSDLTEEIDLTQPATALGKRISTPRIDKFFLYTNRGVSAQSEDSDFIAKKSKKRVKKA